MPNDLTVQLVSGCRLSAYPWMLVFIAPEFVFSAKIAGISFIYRVSQKKRGAFDGLWHRIEPFDYREPDFSVQPRV